MTQVGIALLAIALADSIATVAVARMFKCSIFASKFVRVIAASAFSISEI
jgi:hypothetical protein